MISLDNLTREELIEIRTAVDRLLYLPPDWPRHLKQRAPFRELLALALRRYWEREPAATEWRGSVSRLCCLFQQDTETSKLANSVRLEQAKRFLQELEAEGLCRIDNGGIPHNIWLFPKAATQEKL